MDESSIQLIGEVSAPIKRSSKATNSIAYLDSQGNKNQIEVLAGPGKQFCCCCWHPDTNEPYYWTGTIPLNVRADEWPEVSEEQLRQIIEEFELTAEEMGMREQARGVKRD